VPGKALVFIHDGEECDAIRAALTNVGLTVCCAQSAAEAIESCEANTSFDLLIADVMPEKGWTANAVGDHLRAKCPSAGILFTSTCPLNRLLEMDALTAEQFGDGRTVFLRRPLPDTVLLGKVWDLMGRRGIALSWPPLVAAAAAGQEVSLQPAESEPVAKRRRARREVRTRNATFAAGA
jgi:CheY-like chemotaxis protein